MTPKQMYQDYSDDELYALLKRAREDADRCVTRDAREAVLTTVKRIQREQKRRERQAAHT